MYKTYHYDNMPHPITGGGAPPPEPKPEPKPESISDETNPVISKKPIPSKPRGGIGGMLGNLQSDDLILLAVIVVLLMDDCDDKLLLAALGIIFVMGLNE